jgi:CheY-like chemotaxis protein
MPYHILYIEDNLNTARAMKVMLELKGHRVELAGTVSEALQALERDPFDVVLSDITLPDGTGYDVLSRASRPLKAIALSGYTGAQDRQDALDKGFAEYVTKPFQIGELLLAIERVAV